MLSCSATTNKVSPTKKKNPATAAALTTALVWSNVPDAILVIAQLQIKARNKQTQF